MDGSRFDSLTRSLAERPSRRRVLSAMLGAVTAGLAGVAGRGADAAGRCKTVGQACQTSADCCPGALGNGNVYCPGGKKATCQSCPNGTVACNGACVNTGTDSGNCGACGKTCFGESSCLNGSCQCPHGQHFDGAGACTCEATSCQETGDCCAGYACNPDTAQCEVCTPVGGFAEHSELCCSGVRAGSYCTSVCTTSDDCPGTQICRTFGEPTGICLCSGSTCCWCSGPTTGETCVATACAEQCDADNGGNASYEQLPGTDAVSYSCRADGHGCEVTCSVFPLSD